jgi:4-amino-4-deoxy-L-arabinose transferase-like glycosyltransferase
MRVIWESRWAHIDMLFCLFLLLSIYFFAQALLGRIGDKQILWTYLFMALATLAKGLIGVVLPGLLVIAFIAARRDWRSIGKLKLPIGIPLFLLVASPWFILVQHATGGQWLNDFLFIHHLQRYTAGAGHRQPFYYYVTTLPADLLPWTIFAVPALLAYRPFRRVWQEPILLFFVLWFVTVFLFFSASDTKRELYLLPLLPVVALLIGNYLDDLSAGAIQLSGFGHWLILGNFALIAVLGVASPLVAWIIRREALGAMVPGSMVLAVGGAVALGYFWRRRPIQGLTSVALMMILLVVTSALWVFPYLEQFKSRRRFAAEIRQIVPEATPLYVYADGMHDFNFYLRRERVVVVESAAQVQKLANGRQKSYMLIKDRDLKRQKVVPRQWIVRSDVTGSATWHLVELMAPPAGGSGSG